MRDIIRKLIKVEVTFEMRLSCAFSDEYSLRGGLPILYVSIFSFFFDIRSHHFDCLILCFN